MKINICYRDSTSETAERLANDLSSATSCNITLNQNAQEDCFNISWGYQGDEKFLFLNKPEKIKSNINKLNTNIKLEKAGCDVIKAYGKKEIIDAYNNKLIDTPIVARGLSTQNGNNLFVCLCKKQLAKAVKDGYEMFKPYIKPKREFRVHIFKGNPILIIRKTFHNPYSIYRNDEEEEIVTKGYPKKIIQMSKKAIEVAELDFGAVDILEGENGKLYILEINTAPALNRTMRELYIKEIKDVLIQNGIIQ